MEGRNLNNVQLGQEIGVSHVTIGNFLGGQLPKSEHLFALAEHFGVSMEELLGGREAAEDFLARRDGWRADLAEKTGAAEKFMAAFPQRDLRRRLNYLAERQGKLAEEQKDLQRQMVELLATVEGKYPPHAQPSVLLNERGQPLKPLPRAALPAALAKAHPLRAEVSERKPRAASTTDSKPAPRPPVSKRPNTPPPAPVPVPTAPES